MLNSGSHIATTKYCPKKQDHRMQSCYGQCIYVSGPTHPCLCEFDYFARCTSSFEPYSQELRSNSYWAQDHTSPRPKIVKNKDHHINKLNFSFCCSSWPPPQCNVGGPLLNACRKVITSTLLFWGGAGGLGARRRLMLSLLLGWPPTMSGCMLTTRPKEGFISQHVSDYVIGCGRTWCKVKTEAKFVDGWTWI